MEKVVITGVTSGFGTEWLYALDEQKEADFYVLARNEGKFRALITERPLSNRVHFVACDLSSFDSINTAVGQLGNLTDRVDVLINNAGLWSTDNIALSGDGVEATIAVNQLAPYLLTGKLLPLLLNSTQAKVINTASFRHTDAKVDQADIELKSNYDPELAYCNSKLFSILFTRQLAMRLSASAVSVNCFDPGIVDTPMLKKAFPKKLSSIYPLFRRFVARSPEKGAETGVFLSDMQTCEGVSGAYFRDKKVKQPSAQAMDEALGAWLWQESERLSGYVYPE